MLKRATSSVGVAMLIAATLAACGAASSGPVATGPRIALTFAPSHPLTRKQLGTTRSILQRRLSAAHLDGAQVTIAGNRIQLVVPSDRAAAASGLVQAAGQLRFRQALSIAKVVTPEAVVPAPSPSNGSPALPGSESRTLSAAFERSYRQWDCDQRPNPTMGADDPADFIIGCELGAHQKYLLAPAAVEGSQIDSTNAGLDQNGKQWVVNVAFTHGGSTAWFSLTKDAWEATNGHQSGPDSCSPPKGCNAVGIVLDGVVESAPAVQTDGIAGGATQISGNFSRARADTLAAILRSGALPAPLSLESEAAK
jgi:hypothetical protein